MSLVLDSSETLNWYFEDERTPATVALRRQVAESGATVPGLCRLEEPAIGQPETTCQAQRLTGRIVGGVTRKGGIHD
jgi:hypothetical protein